MGFVPQPVLAAVVAALATVASLSCADSHHPDPTLPEQRPPSTGRGNGPVQDVVRQPDATLETRGVAPRVPMEKSGANPGRA